MATARVHPEPEAPFDLLQGLKDDPHASAAFAAMPVFGDDGDDDNSGNGGDDDSNDGDDDNGGNGGGNDD